MVESQRSMMLSRCIEECRNCIHMFASLCKELTRQTRINIPSVCYKRGSGSGMANVRKLCGEYFGDGY
jgi:hypothetical protein